MGRSDPPPNPPSAQGDHSSPPSPFPLPDSHLNKGVFADQCPENPHISINMEELAALCLLGQVWDDPMPLPAIIHKTKSNWRFLKGQVDYVELGNNWILLHFANTEDKEMVWQGRPWFVVSFNFVLTCWVPFFDPFSVCIGRIDQWVRVPRLPWEFWDLETLTNLLKFVGTVIKVDQNTLLRLKGKFARACVNLDITEPLPGSLMVAFASRSMTVPLIYEGLHEFCALCGSEAHQIESCTLLRTQSKREVRIEKFGVHDASAPHPSQSATTPSTAPISSTEKWIRVSPKKRLCSFSAKPTRFNSSGITPSNIVVKHPTPPLSPIPVPPLYSPVHPNDPDSPHASAQSSNTEKIVLACSANMNISPHPVSENPEDLMEDDKLKILLWVWVSWLMLMMMTLLFLFLTLSLFKSWSYLRTLPKDARWKRGMKSSLRSSLNNLVFYVCAYECLFRRK